MTTTENYVQEYEAICGLFRDNWNALHPSIPIAWENVKSDINNKSSRAEFYVLNGESSQVSVGNPDSNRFRHAGVVMVNLYVESGTGKTVIMGMADEVADIFRRKRIGSIFFLDPKVSPLGNDGNYYGVNVSIALYRDSYHKSNGGN